MAERLLEGLGAEPVFRDALLGRYIAAALDSCKPLVAALAVGIPGRASGRLDWRRLIPHRHRPRAEL